WFDIFLGPVQLMHRPLPATTPQALCGLNFFHPTMQETLSSAAVAAGAEVRRGAAVREIRHGATPSVVVEDSSGTQEISARLIVCADGRSSQARRHFQVKQDAPFL